MQTLTEIKQLLEERGLRPKHRLGQNFLHDKNQLQKLLDAANVQRNDVILEVGPGTGTLTSALLDRHANVIACELDADMAAIIAHVFANQLHDQSLTLIQADALERDRQLNPQIIAAITNHSFKLVANLPYQIASPLMSSLLTDHPNCTGQFVTIQKEVADRLLAKPSTKEYGPLSIIVQAFATVNKIGTLSASCFWPAPDVTSAMIAIHPHPRNDAFSSQQRREFARFIVELFTKRRKQLGTIIGRSSNITWPEGVTPDLRPEALSVDQLIALWRVLPHDHSSS